MSIGQVFRVRHRPYITTLIPFNKPPRILRDNLLARAHNQSTFDNQSKLGVILLQTHHISLAATTFLPHLSI